MGQRSVGKSPCSIQIDAFGTNATADLTFQNDEFISNSSDGTLNFGAADLVTTGQVTLTGGSVLATQSTVIWSQGGSGLLVTSGADIAMSDGDSYWSEIIIPYNMTITGLTYLVGSVGGTDSVMLVLHNSAGTPVAWSDSTGATKGDVVGTTAELQSIDFEVPYAAIAGKYYISLQANGTTGKFRAYTIPGSKFIAGTDTGTWGDVVAITPGTTFTADKGPICSTY